MRFVVTNLPCGQSVDSSTRTLPPSFFSLVAYGSGTQAPSMEPVWKDGQFVPRQMLPLSLSYDHRQIDGADAIRFLRWVVEAVEQPFLLSLIG